MEVAAPRTALVPASAVHKSRKMEEGNASGNSVPTSAVSSEARRSSATGGPPPPLAADPEPHDGLEQDPPGHQAPEDQWEAGSVNANDSQEGDASESARESGRISRSESAQSEGLVRQESNFSRLSAQSWESVESTEMPDAELGKMVELVRGSSSGADGDARPTFSGENNFMSGLGSRAAEGLAAHAGPSDVLEIIKGKPVRERSVLECAVQLLGGMAALKKKNFRRFGMRRVWLSEDCSKLFWMTKKTSYLNKGHVRLSRVGKVRLQDRELMLETTESQRKTFLFDTEEEAELWTRFLGCFVPLQARVKAPEGVVLKDKELEDYDLGEDLWDGKPLRQLKTVNDYVILGVQRGFDEDIKLALSRATRTFVGIRHLSSRVAVRVLRTSKEIATLKQLNHPNLLRYRECLADPTRGGNYVLFEYAPRGPVIETMRTEGVRPIPEVAARGLIRDVIAGLEYLHASRMAHGDVRPQNLSRAVDGSVKLNPLGCIMYDITDLAEQAEITQSRLGEASCAFIAPEQCWLSEKRPPLEASSGYAMDVWSLGSLLYFMLYGRVPFGGRTPRAIQDNICTGKLKFPRVPETSRKVRNLLKGLVGEKDPASRIRLVDLKRHPWLTDGLDPAALAELADAAPRGGVAVTQDEVRRAVGRAKVRLPY